MTVDRFHHRIHELTERVRDLRGRIETLGQPGARITLHELQRSLDDLRAAERDLLEHEREDSVARDALERERSRYSELFDFVPDPSLVTDREGVIEEANRAATHLLHAGLPQLVGHPLATFVERQGRASFRAWLSEIVRTGQRAQRVFIIQPRRRALIHASFTARAVTDHADRRAFVRWQVRDVTDRVVIEERARLLDEEVERRVGERTEELRQANSVKDELLGLVSHELKTPITTIYGNAQVLRRRADMLTPEDRATAIADIEDEAARVQRLIDDLLTLARIETGSQLAIEPLLVRHAVRRVAETHRRAHPHRAVEIREQPDLPPVAADPVYFDQVIRNLLSNAEKYSPPDCPIVVRIQRDGDDVTVAVLDEGPGIDPEEADAIFTPFFRSSRTVRAAAGAGIGLAVCRRLVEAQGGRIWARRRTGGPGSEIAFALHTFQE